MQQSHCWAYIWTKWHMCSYVHSSTFHNGQDMEATWMSTDRWMDKEDVAHAYSGVLFSHKSEMMPFIATGMDLEMIMLTEESQKEKDIYHVISLYVESKLTQMNLFTKQKQIHRHKEQTCSCDRRMGGEGQSGSLQLANANYYMWNGKTMRNYSISPGTIFSILW